MNEVLTVKNLSASYGNHQILENISLTLSKGELVCLCGPNGSGKSTLLGILAGVSSPKLNVSWEVLPDYLKLQRKLMARKVSFLSQTETSAWDITVRDFVLSGRYAYSDFWGNFSEEDKKISKLVCEKSGLEKLWDKSVLEISGGEYQRARIARSFAQGTDFLFMDEPLSGLDMVYEHNLMSLLREMAHKEKKGIIISVHDVNVASRFADRLMLLPPGGQIISGEAEEVITEENLKKTYGANFRIRDKFVEIE